MLLNAEQADRCLRVSLTFVRDGCSRRRRQIAALASRPLLMKFVVNSPPLRPAWLPLDTTAMARKPDPPKPGTWTIYKIAAKAVRLGTIEAADEAAAIEKGAAAFKVPANRLMAIRR
jgi:hypothetical protein